MDNKTAIGIINKAWSNRIDSTDYPNFDDINEAIYTLEETVHLYDKAMEETTKINGSALALFVAKTARKENKELREKVKRLKKSAKFLKETLGITLLDDCGFPIFDEESKYVLRLIIEKGISNREDFKYAFTINKTAYDYLLEAFEEEIDEVDEYERN